MQERKREATTVYPLWKITETLPSVSIAIIDGWKKCLSRWLSVLVQYEP